MSLKDKMGTALAADPALVALVGDRIGPDTEDNGNPPYIAYHQYDGGDEHTYAGVAMEQEIGIELDCVAGTYTVAQNVANAVEAAMQAWAKPGNLRPQKVDRDDEYDTATGRHYVTLQYQIWWNGRE